MVAQFFPDPYILHHLKFPVRKNIIDPQCGRYPCIGSSQPDPLFRKSVFTDQTLNICFSGYILKIDESGMIFTNENKIKFGIGFRINAECLFRIFY